MPESLANLSPGLMQSRSVAPAAWGHAPERQPVPGSYEGWEQTPWEETFSSFPELSCWLSTWRTWFRRADAAG